MESINLEMEDLFDQEAGDDEDIGAQALLPELDGDEDGPMRSEGEQNEQDDEEGVVANLQRLSKGASKKKVTKPQPKLDVERLKSERGLAVLPRIFEDVKFKGKGHEAQDLKLLMTKLEHWAHRLYPMSTFDQFIERMEKLGTKKPVQTCLKRVRLDMPLLDNDFVAQYDEPQASPENEKPVEEEEMNEVDAEEAFEEMMRLEKEKLKQTASAGTDDIVDSEAGPISEITKAEKECGFIGDTLTSPDQTNVPAPSTPVTHRDKGEMTPDIKERIEANKLKALEKRAAKLGVPVERLLSPKRDNDSHKTQVKDQSQYHRESGSNLDKAGNQLEVSSQPTSQLEPCSQISSKTLVDQIQESTTLNTGKSSVELEDMQTEEALMEILESDGNADELNSTKNNNVTGTPVKAEQMSEKAGSIKLNLDPENLSPSDRPTDLNSSAMNDSSDNDGLNLHLDMSVSEAVDTEASNGLNLQLDLSVNEG